MDVKEEYAQVRNALAVLEDYLHNAGNWISDEIECAYHELEDAVEAKGWYEGAIR